VIPEGLSATVGAPMPAVRSRFRLRTATVIPAWRSQSLAGRISVLTLAAVTVGAIIAPHLAPHSPNVPVGIPFTPPFHSGAWLGTDQVGRDVLSRVLSGISTSWLSTLAVVIVMASVGTLVGVIAAFSGGILDRVLMAIVDFFLSLPGAVVAIVIAAALGPSLMHALLAIAVLGWPYYARVIRSETRALMHRPHMEAARLARASRTRLLTKHLIPGTLPALVVNVSLDLGGILVLLAGLSFLGLGQPEPAPELGAMTAQGLTFLLTNWWIPVVPGLVVMGLALIANFAGDGIRTLLRFH
jgi:peptide/nickel transport system permease protein